jgi:hypothetical protein
VNFAFQTNTNNSFKKMKRKITSRTAAILFGLFVVVYFLSAKGYVQIKDSRPSIATAYSLVDNSSLAIEIKNGRMQISSDN